MLNTATNCFFKFEREVQKKDRVQNYRMKRFEYLDGYSKESLGIM